MNLDSIIGQILGIAEFPQEKRQKFINAFYTKVLVDIFESVKVVDSQAAGQLDQVKSNEELQKILEKLSENPEMKEKIDKAADEAFSILADDISKYATEEQKRKILAILPQ